MTNNWKVIDEEPYGTTDNMVWMMNDIGNKALFKPDISGDDYLIKLSVYTLAKFFNISYSRVASYSLEGIKGFLSFVEDTKRFHRINGADLYRNGEKFNSRPISIGNTKYTDDIDYSLEGLKCIVTDGCFKDLCMTAFLDALCRNQDRHIGNIDFLLNLNGNIIAVAPLYDTVMSFSNSISESTMLGVTSQKVWTHKEVFNYLKELDFMKESINLLKTNSFKNLCDELEYGDFIYNRAKSFISSTQK